MDCNSKEENKSWTLTPTTDTTTASRGKNNNNNNNNKPKTPNSSDSRLKQQQQSGKKKGKGAFVPFSYANQQPKSKQQPKNAQQKPPRSTEENGNRKPQQQRTPQRPSASTSRSQTTTPKSQMTTPKSQMTTPRSQMNTPRSQSNTPRTTPQQRQPQSTQKSKHGKNAISLETKEKDFLNLPEICPEHLRVDLMQSFESQHLSNIDQRSSDFYSPSRHNGPPSALSSPSPGSKYCSACNKEFTSEATYKSHENSAKHLKAVSQKRKDCQKVINDPNRNTIASEALMFYNKAENIIEDDIEEAVKCYWNASNGFANAFHYRKSAVCFASLIKIIETNEQLSKAPVHQHMKLESSLKLARLLKAFDFQRALTFYLKNINRYFLTTRLFELRQACGQFEELTKKCNLLWTALTSRVKISPENLAEKVIYNILEVGTFIQEHNRGLKRTPGYTSLEYDDLAIVLFCLASTIALNVGLTKWLSYACDALYVCYQSQQIGWGAIDVRLFEISRNGQLDCNETGLRLTNQWKCLVEVLLLSLELEDLVRYQKILQLTSTLKKATNPKPSSILYAEISDYNRIVTICETIGRCMEEGDWKSLSFLASSGVLDQGFDALLSSSAHLELKRVHRICSQRNVTVCRY